MLNMNSSLEDIKKNLDFGVYGTISFNSNTVFFLVGQKKFVVYKKNSIFEIIDYSMINFFEIIEVFSGGGLEFGLIPTRPNFIKLGHEIKIRSNNNEIIIPLDFDDETSDKLNKENLEKILELMERFYPQMDIHYNNDPFYL